MWLETICRTLHDHETGIATITCSEYLERYPRAGFIAMPEGSWGAEGQHRVWMNAETSWTYAHIYRAETSLRDVCTAGTWRESELGGRIVRQLCRELLLIESSDWQSLRNVNARSLLRHDIAFRLQLLKGQQHGGARNTEVRREGTSRRQSGVGADVAIVYGPPNKGIDLFLERLMAGGLDPDRERDYLGHDSPSLVDMNRRPASSRWPSGPS